MTKRALLVARVSTTQQFEKGYSVPTQLEGMRAYCAAHGLAVTGELTDDCSGTVEIFDRPGGRQIQAAIKARTIEAVVFYTIDRASRDEDVIDFLLLKRELRNTGIELHFADTGQSQNDSITSVIEYLKVSEAGRELKKIVERTSRGRRAKAEAGKWVGGGQTPYGYSRRGKRADAHLVILEREARVVRQIFDWYTGAGARPALSTAEIANRLTAGNVPPPSRGKPGRGWYRDTVRCVLANPLYIGEMSYGGIVKPFPKLALVDAQTWAVAQEYRERNKALGRHYSKRHYLLAGHLQCMCLKSLIGVTRRPQDPAKSHAYYTCGARWSNPHMTDCRARSMRQDEADSKVWGWVAGLLSSEANIRAGLHALAERRELDLAPRRGRLELVSELIADAEAKIARWLAAFGAEADSFIRETIQARVRETAQMRDSLVAERDMLAAELAQGSLTAEDEEHICELAAELRAGIVEADYALKRYLLERLGVLARLQEDAGGRWLECTCAIPGWQSSVFLGDPAGQDMTDSCGRARRDWSRVVIFSASIPLDGRPLPALDLTVALFEPAADVSKPIMSAFVSDNR